MAMFNHMQLMHTELVELKNSNAKFQASLSIDGVNNKIMALRQEIAELKTTTNNLAVSSSIPMDHSCARDNTKEPKISLPEKLDGMRLKFCGFVMQVQLFLHMHPSHYYNDCAQVGYVSTLLSGIALS